MYLLPFITYTEHLDLVRIIDCLVQYFDHVLGLFICGLVTSLLEVGSGVLLEHAKVAYLVAL